MTKTSKKSLSKFTFAGFILILVGLGLLLTQPFKEYLVKSTSEGFTEQSYSREKIVENEKVNASFDYAEVKTVDLSEVIQASRNSQELAVIGQIVAPTVNLNLPIIKGVSDESISSGAGTMHPNQRMGEGNYALASHRMMNPDLLFSPTLELEIGDSIYLSDMEKIYTYQVVYLEMVEPTRIDLIEPIPGKKLLTLITCNEDGSLRWFSQAELVNIRPLSEATEEMTDAFTMIENNAWLK